MNPSRRPGAVGAVSWLQLALLLLWLSTAPTPRLAGQDPYLVKDINTNTEDVNARARTVVNGTLFFAGHDDGNGTELWKSNGTPQGTALVKDIFPGRGGSSPDWFVDAGGTLFFTADDGANGSELWKSDGTPEGTVLVRDVTPGKESSPQTYLTNVNGLLFFAAEAPGGLWKSDGTPGGTVMVKHGFNPYGLTDLNGILLFVDGVFDSESLWKSDGTTDGTVLVHQGVNPSSLTRVGNTLFFVDNAPGGGPELWKSDGTPEGTVLVKDIRPGPEGSSVGNLTDVSGTLFFSALNETGNTFWLWKSNGSPEGTVLVKDDSFSASGEFTEANGILFFVGYDDSHGFELWKSDGTPGGTGLVKDIYPGEGNSAPYDLTSVGKLLYFTVWDEPAFGHEVWKSDGTPDGTVLVRDIIPGPGSSKAVGLVDRSGSLLFGAHDPTGEAGLWSSDGTAAGTTVVKRVSLASTESSNPVQLTAVNGTLFFVTSNGDGIDTLELWKSDGTPGGTGIVKELEPGVNSSLTNVNGTLFFVAQDSTGSRTELWKTDGTPEGTVLVRDFEPGPEASGLDWLTEMNGSLFLQGSFVEAIGGRMGPGLWISDGTPEGTVLVKPLPGRSLEGRPRAVVNGTLFFGVQAGANGQLWRSDGTPEGTVHLKDIFSENFTASDGRLFFFGREPGLDPPELWKSDGTPEGTVPVKALRTDDLDSDSVADVNGTLFFRAADVTRSGDHELWKSDGTPEGTVMVKDIWPGPEGSFPESLTNVEGTLYFTSNDGVHGHELWKSDGTPEGTVMVKDIYPGPFGSMEEVNGALLTNVNGTLYFKANTETHGIALWRSDGTPEGTVLVAYICQISGNECQPPDSLTPVGGTLFFAADDGFHGKELWALRSGTTPLRGDADGNGQRNISDAINLLGCLFLGSECPDSDCARDVNSDENANISDAIFLLNHLFRGGDEPQSCP